MKKEPSRHRVLTSIDHKEPSSLPIDFGSSTSTGISVFSYAKLVNYLKLNSTEIPKLYELFLMMADPSMEVIDRMGGDIVQVKRYAPHWNIVLDNWKDMTLPGGITCLVPGGFSPQKTENGWEILNDNGIVIACMPTGSSYFEQTVYPYSGIELFDHINSSEFSGITNEELQYLYKESKRLHKETDKAVMYPAYCRVFEAGMNAWGFEEWLIQLMTNNGMVKKYLDKLTEMHINDITKVLDSCGEYIDIVRFVDDLGTQTSQIMSIDMYRELIKPYHMEIFNHIKKKYPKQKIALHSCGSIKPFIPEFIEMGVDIINPVQISATDMDPVTLKREFGKDIVFWGGGADMQFEALSGDQARLSDHVKRMIDVFAVDGGFIFAPTHNIQADISPETILTIYDTANSY